nr:NAD(P)H-dependent oxidoreductase [Arthrobacter sp. TB 23]
MPAEVFSVSQRLHAADAFVVVTPEYNHSSPASLKNAIDWSYEEWQTKPVGFVSYGGISDGLRAIEHLRPVISEVHHSGLIRNIDLKNALAKVFNG